MEAGLTQGTRVELSWQLRKVLTVLEVEVAPLVVLTASLPSSNGDGVRFPNKSGQGQLRVDCCTDTHGDRGNAMRRAHFCH